MRIETLVEDIQDVLLRGSSKVADEVGKAVSSTVSAKLSEDHSEAYLRLSNIGTPCRRQLWYSIRMPELAETIRPDALLKFMYGHILEAVVLLLAKVAGHRVEGEQDRLELHGVPGHRDAVIDGVLVDAKSASTYSFNKFVSGLKPDDDAFGYIGQLNAYLEASQDDPLVVEKDRAAFLVVDKTLGKITLDIHPKQDKDYKTYVSDTQEMLKQDLPPERGFKDEEFGKSGNRSLGVNCSYCRWKHTCWPGLRGFAYARGPVWLTKVRREPDVPEFRE